MKKIFFLLTLILFSISSFAQEGVKFETGTFKEALTKAKNNKKGPKIVFMDCYTSWCGPCKHMANVVFPTKEAGDYFNKNFVNFKCDMEKGEGVEIAKKFNVKAYPTFLILDADGNEIGRLLGSGELKGFIESVEKAKNPENNVANQLKKYNSTKEIEDAYKYLSSLQDLYMEEEITKFFNENLDSLKEMRFDSKTWNYLAPAISLKNTKILNDVLDNKFSYDYYNSKGAVDKALLNAYTKGLDSYLRGKLTLTENELNKACDALNLMTQDNYYDFVLIEASKALQKNDIKGINSAFNARMILYSCSLNDANSALNTYTSIKAVSDSDKAKFIKDYKGRTINSLLKNADRLEGIYKAQDEVKK